MPLLRPARAAAATAAVDRATQRPLPPPGWIALAVALPFLLPFAAAPLSNFWQWWGTWLCLAGLALCAPLARPSGALLLWLAAAAAVLGLGPGGDAVLRWAGVASVALVAWAACVGAGLRHCQGAALRALAWGLLAAGTLSALLGLVQYFGQADALGPLLFSPIERIGMAYGNLRQRNQFATLMSMALVVGLWLHAELPRARPWLLACAALLIAGLAASISRTGLLQALAIGALVGALSWRERRAARSAPVLPHPGWTLAGLGLYLLLAWALPQWASATGAEVQGMMSRLHSGAPPGHSRWLLWRNVLELTAQHPWTGWGWGELSYAHYSTLYAGPRFVEILSNARNLPLHLAVECGVPAALALCGGFVWLVLRARPWAARDSVQLMAWGLLSVLLVHSLLEYPLWYGPFQLLAGLSLGLLWPEQSAAGRGFAAAQSAGQTMRTALAALPLAAALTVLAWDYVRISQIYLPPEKRLSAWQKKPQEKLRERSWLFEREQLFAELTLTPLTPANAAWVYDRALALLHFSPEPRVVQRLIDSAKLLGRHEEALAHTVRLHAAYGQRAPR